MQGIVLGRVRGRGRRKCRGCKMENRRWGGGGGRRWRSSNMQEGEGLSGGARVAARVEWELMHLVTA